MALTLGDGPFGKQAAGSFNFDLPDAADHTLYVEASPRKVSAVVAGETVAKSSRMALLHETGLLPVYYFPRDDVREELLERSDSHTHCPVKGDASYWHLSVGDSVHTDAAWAYPEPLDSVPELAELIAFRWDAIDEWYEEAHRIGVHPRDPYHRVDVLPSDRHVVVRVGDEAIAESSRPTMLFETSLPPRFYLPEADVRPEVLEASDMQTSCPYKGTTSRYYTVVAGGQRLEDAVWCYDEPYAGLDEVAGKLAFFNERVDLEVDGEPWQPPTTVFSRSVRGALA